MPLNATLARWRFAVDTPMVYVHGCVLKRECDLMDKGIPISARVIPNRGSIDWRKVAARLLSRAEAAEARLEELTRERERLITAQRSPSTLHQGAEEFLCGCGAAGSGEGHADWCPFEQSEWKKWGDAFSQAASLAARLEEAKAVLGLAIEYWAHRQQRYKNRHPAWVQAARAFLHQGVSDAR